MKLWKKASDSQMLFPAMSKVRTEEGIFSLNGLTDGGIVKRETGVNLDLRMCRRTFGQVGIDNGVSTESVRPHDGTYEHQDHGEILLPEKAGIGDPRGPTSMGQFPQASGGVQTYGAKKPLD